MLPTQDSTSIPNGKSPKKLRPTKPEKIVREETVRIPVFSGIQVQNDDYATEEKELVHSKQRYVLNQVGDDIEKVPA